MKPETTKNIVLGIFAGIAISLLWMEALKQMLKSGLITVEQFNHYLFRPMEFALALKERRFKETEKITEVWAEYEEVVTPFQLPQKKDEKDLVV